MKKLQLLVLLLILLSCADAVDVQTDSVAATINSVLSDPGRDKSLQTFVLRYSTTNYTLDSSTLSLPIDSTLASNIQFVGPTLIGSATNLEMCDNLPSLTFKNIQFDSLTSLKFNSLRLILSSNDNFLNASRTTQITFQSCCIYQQNWDSTLSFKASFSNGSNLKFADSLFFFQSDSPWNMQIASILNVEFANSVIYYDQKNFTASCSGSYGVSETLFVSVDAGSSVSMSNLTISTKSTSGMDPSAIKGFIDIKNTPLISLSDVKIQQINTYPQSCSWFSILNSTNVTLQDLSLSKMTVTTQDGKRSVIEIHKVAQSLQVSGLKIEDAEFYGLSDYTVTDSILFLSEANELIVSNISIDRSVLDSTVAINMGKSSGFGAISAVNIGSSVFNYGALYCYIGSLPSTTYRQNNSLSMQNVSVLNSKIDGEFVFADIKSEKEITDPAMTVQLKFEGFIFNNNTINDSNLFALKNNQLDFDYYAVLELFSVNFSSISFFNNTIGFGYKGEWITEINLFHIFGYSAFLSNINLTHNNLTNSSILTIGMGVCSYILSNSSIVHNQFDESVITRFPKATLFTILPSSFLSVVGDKTYQTIFYRYGIISGNNVSNNTFRSSTAIFYVLQPMRLIESNFFSGNNLTQVPILECQSRFQYQSPFSRDLGIEYYLFSRLPSKVMNALNSAFDESISLFGQILPFIRVTNNDFTSLQVADAPMFEVGNFEIEKAIVLIDNNSFRQIQSNQSVLLNGYSLGFTIIKSNLFSRITGNKFLIYLTSQQPWSSLAILSNELSECEGIGLLTYDSAYSGGVLMHNNTITSNRIGRVFISLLVQNWNGDIEFSANTVKNNELYCMYANQLNFIDIQAPRPYQDAVFHMSDNIFINITLLENHPLVDQMYQNNFLHLGLANATSYFRNTTFDGVLIRWEGNLMRIASSNIIMQQCVFNNISNYDEEGIIFAVTQSLTVESTSVTAVAQELNDTHGSIFNIARDPYYDQSVDVLIWNSTFKNSAATQGSILIANKVSLNLTASNNTFIDNHQFIGSAFYITNSFLERFIFENFSLVITDKTEEFDELNFNFLGFKNCSGSANVRNGVMLVSPSPTTIFMIKDSAQLQFNVSGLYLAADPASTLPSNRSEITLFQTNTGKISFNNVTMTNLTNFDTPFMYFECNKDTTILFHGHMINATGLSLKNSSSFSSNTGLGVITITGNSGFLNLTLEESRFDDIQSVFRGGGIANGKVRGAQLMIVNSTFINARARSGAAVYFIGGDPSDTDETLTGSSLYINSSYFKWCRSTENAGGAVYHFSGSGKISVYNSTFDSNSAMIRGGAIYTDYFEDSNFYMTTMANNKFIYNYINLTNQTNDIGGDLVDVDLTLRGNMSMMSMTKENGAITIYNASVSSFQNLALTFRLVDTYRQLYFDPDPNKILFLNITGSEYSTTDCTNYTCVIRDSKMQLLGQSGSQIRMDVTYKKLKKRIPIHLRNCTQGEYFYALSCIPCSPGTYSIDPSRGTCYDCPDNAVCEEGIIVDIINGYWRGIDETYLRADGTPAPYKANLHKCDPDVNSCLRNNICAEGYTGPLCAQCDFEKGYVPRGKKCGKCADTGYLVLQMLGWSVVFIAYQTWFIRSMVQTNRDFYDVIKRGGHYISSAGPYIRLLTTFSQIMTIVSTFNLNLQEFFNIDFSLGSPTTTIIYPATCLLSRMGLEAVQTYYWELSIITLLPIFQWGVFALCIIGIFRAQKRQIYQLSNLIFATLVGLIMLEQPAIFQSLLKSLATKKLDPNSDIYYLSANPSVPADEYYYKYSKYFVVPNLLIWGPGIALLLAFILLAYRKSFNTERMRLVLGGYINEYREETFYWGLVLMCFKLVLMTVASFLSDDQKTKVLVTVALFYLYKRSLMRYSPYYEDKLLNTEKYAQYAYFGSIFFLYLFEDNPYPWLKYFCLAVCIILNMFVVFYIFFHIWRVSKQKVERGFEFFTKALKRMATTVSRGSVRQSRKDSNFSEESGSSRNSLASRPSYLGKNMMELNSEASRKNTGALDSIQNSFATSIIAEHQVSEENDEQPDIDKEKKKEPSMIDLEL